MADGSGWGELLVPRVQAPARSGHIASCVNRYLLIWGGYQDYSRTDRYLPAEDIWLYDIELQFWKVYSSKGDIPKGTSGAGSELIDDCLYVFAGHTDLGNVNCIYRLDLHGLEWEKMVLPDPLPSPRDKFVTWSHRSNLYCFGGFGPPIYNFLCQHGDYVSDPTTYLSYERGWNNQLLVFDTSTESWNNPYTKGGLPSPRAAHAAAKINSQVYIFGGRHCNVRLNDIHRLDIDTLQWSGELHATGSLPCGRSWHSLTPVSSQQLFMYGGYSNDNVPLSDAWLFNVALLEWTQLAISQNRPRIWHTANFVNEDVLIFGGCCNDILNLEEDNIHSSEIFIFHFQPYTLERLSLEAVYRSRKQTEKSWSDLPEDLRKWLLIKSKSMEPQQRNQIAIDHRLNRIANQTTCSIS